MLIQTSQGLKDVPVTEVTKDNYSVPKGEEHLYHTIIEVRKHRESDGARLSKPRVQKFGRKSFETMIQGNLKRQGFQLVILHDPAQWLAANQQKLADQQAAQEQAAVQARQRAEEQRKQAEAEAKEKEAEEAQARLDQTVKAALDAQRKEFEKTQQEAINKAVQSALRSQQKPAAETSKSSTSTEEKK